MGRHRHGARRAYYHFQIVKFADCAIDAEPVDAGAVAEINDLHPAPGFRVRVLQPPVQGQPVGVQFVGRAGRDSELLVFARQISECLLP